MAWLLWILELLIPATMALFGLLAARAGYKKAGRVLLVGGAVLAALTAGVKLWALLPAATQAIVDVGAQLVVFGAVALYAGRCLKNEK